MLKQADINRKIVELQQEADELNRAPLGLANVKKVARTVEIASKMAALDWVLTGTWTEVVDLKRTK